MISGCWRDADGKLGKSGFVEGCRSLGLKVTRDEGNRWSVWKYIAVSGASVGFRFIILRLKLKYEL